MALISQVTSQKATQSSKTGMSSDHLGGIHKPQQGSAPKVVKNEKPVSNAEETTTNTSKNPSAVLPVNLEAIPKAHHFPSQRHRWNTNEEIAAILICLDKHEDWLSKEVKIRPKSGSMLLYSRKRVRYRRDGYCWKKRKDGKTTREDHMKLKVQGTECIYGCYVHSAILPTFHRRCYWLLQNPDIVLVHYLNVPYSSDDNKALISPSLSYCADKKEWTKEELVSQLKPMFYSETKPDLNNELELSMAETVETIVQQLMDKQRSKPRTGDCSCDNKNKVQKNVINKCAPTLHCIISPKAVQQQSNNNVSSSSSVSGTSAGQREPEGRPAAAAASGGSVILATPCRPSDANSAATSLILNLSQLQGGGGLLILNGTSTGAARMSLAASSTAVTPLTLICNQDPAATIPATLPNSTSSSHTYSHPSSSTASTTPSPISANTLISAARNNGTHHVLKMSKLPNTNILNIHNNNIKVMTSSATTNPHHQQQALPSEAMQIQESQQSTTIISHPSHKDSIMKASEVLEKKNNGNMPPSENDNVSSLAQHQNSDIKSSSQLPPQAQKKTGISTSTKNVIDFSQEELQKSIAAALFHTSKDYFTLSQEALKKTLTATSLLSISPSTTSSTLTTSMSNTAATNSATANQDVPIKREEEPPQDAASQEDEINPMDFIDTEICSPEDDVYNFDNLDILPDLPNLDDLCLPSYLYPNGPETTHPPPSSLSGPLLREGAANITDYSPEWSYTEGGNKVLVVGPWTSGAMPYSVLFDSMSVPTTLVQNGVLRCHCPAHEAGLVTVQVACNGFVVSNSVTFEYRERQPPPLQEWFNVDVNGLKFLLLERLEWLETKVKPAADSHGQRGCPERSQPANFEDRAVATIQRLMGGLWSDDHSGGGTLTRPDLSLLHLASALGFSRLVCALLRWRAENPSLLLESEVDALSQDSEDCTPLMWACSQGHRDVAILLFQWNRTAANILDSQGRSPFTVAKEQGFEDLVQDLEQLEDSASSLLENMEAGGKVRKLSSQPESSSTRQSSGYSSIPQTPSSSTYFTAERMRPGLIKRSSVDSILCQSSTTFNWGTSSLGGDKRASLDQRLLFSSPILGQATPSLLDSRPCTLGDSTQSLAGSGNISHGEDGFPGGGDDSRVLTLAEQIIAAMPDRIKATSRLQESGNPPDPAMEMSPVDEPPPPFLNDEFNFEFSDHNYRYCEGTGTPASSLSPASPSCLQSPGSGFNAAPLDSPPPTTADFSEFLQASGKIVEKDFSNLTLSDTEQRELYEAAKIIQKAYRSYKGRKQQEEQEKERGAAILIQSYYRRYKQYMYYKQMSKAAQVIQTQYRTYCEHKRFKKCLEVGGTSSFLRSDSPSSLPAHSFYHAGLSDSSPQTSSATNDKRSSREGTPTSGLKRTYSQRRQHQAARKIQQFMRQSKNKLQRERALAAENEPKQEAVAHPGAPPPVPSLDPLPASKPPTGVCWV